MKNLAKYLNYTGLLALLMLSLSGLLAACGDEAKPTASNPTPGPSPTPLVNRKLGYSPVNPVAKVDGVAIGADDFNRAVDEVRATYDEEGGSSLDWSTAENKDLLKTIQIQSLEGLINYQVVAAAAAKENVTASPDEINARLEDFKKQLNGEESYKGWLARRFTTEEEYKKRIAQSVIFDEMSDRHSPVEDKGEQVHVRHILVQTEEEARTLYKQLQQGADFAALAKQFSLDMATATKGGDLDWVFKGQTDQAFETAAFALLPNQVSGPIKTDKGYHLIQLLAKEVRPLPFDLVQQRKQDAFANYIKGLRDKAKIEKFLNL
jgi:parvulin-like peptidyl-prolyl isomerase